MNYKQNIVLNLTTTTFYINSEKLKHYVNVKVTEEVLKKEIKTSFKNNQKEPVHPTKTFPEIRLFSFYFFIVLLVTEVTYKLRHSSINMSQSDICET